MTGWPASAEDLLSLQHTLGREAPSPWRPPDLLTIGGCFVCFPRGHAGLGAAGDPAWAGAALCRKRCEGTSVVTGSARDAYTSGMLALREGPLLEAAVRGLPGVPDVLLVNATGRDHPRCSGLAVHLGAVLGVPTVGVTHRPLLAEGSWPDDVAWATSPLTLDGVTVGYWVRTRVEHRPVAVHAGWRVSPEDAVTVVRRCGRRKRTPE
ncbi:MAG: endonuclease V, partial [Streptomycetales bacterium]